ncbi:MAG: RNA polymerase sigma factor [Verrucomicrobia bacterium]|nr:RNA polymerase sigma factor [Verrucomicrobiota bacterium]
MDTTDSDTLDRDDMVRLAGGENAALDRLMDRHAGSVLRFLTRTVGNAADAQDLAQETFARVHRYRQRYRPSARFSPWLFTIAANLARNHFRWKSRHPSLSLDLEVGSTGQSLGETLPADGQNPQQATAATEHTAAVQQAIDRLPSRLREALVLCTWEGLSVDEAAAVLGTSSKSIESLLYRARRLLRQQLTAWL